MTEHPIILFDAECVLCSANAQFVLTHDRARHFRLAAMQGKVGAALCRRFGINPADPDTIIVVQGDRALRDSDAVLAVCAIRYTAGSHATVTACSGNVPAAGCRVRRTRIAFCRLRNIYLRLTRSPGRRSTLHEQASEVGKRITGGERPQLGLMIGSDLRPL
jgi:predicted DCC family thiol-disulfide oxidoreductase YuxK